MLWRRLRDVDTRIGLHSRMVRTKSSKNWNWNRMSMIGDYELESDIMDELYRNFVLQWMICQDAREHGNYIVSLSM